MQFGQLKRREFNTLLAGAASWPLAAHAQQPERMRRIGVLAGWAVDDQDSNVRLAAFQQRLQQLGWTDGQNVRIDYRFAAGNLENYRKYAAELVALAPDVILTPGASLPHMLQTTRTVPIVFAFAADPVGSGFVESLSRPGGNATGFLMFEYDLCAKWLELLKEIVPGVTRAAVLRDATATVAGIGQFAVIQSVSRSVGVEVSPLNLRDAGETERAITAFVRSSNGGLIVAASAFANVQRNLIVELAARHRLPAVYFERLFVASGGLISYGADFVDQFRRAAGYVDRILRGEKPADLPVQAPTKYDLVINLKTANALGLDLPASVLARADEVIDEPTRVHHSGRRDGSRVAACSTRSADNAGDRVPRQ
jgi:putative tryptophan/tyrosine transport system substrate-binding protein